MYSIIAMDNNGTVAENGLKMNCNNFVPLVNCCDNKWDIAVTKSGVMPTIDPNQGVSGGPKTLVRNIYHANYFSSTVRNKFFVDPSNTQTINHASNSTQLTKPNSPYNQSSPQVVVTSPGAISLDYANHCVAYPSAGPAGNDRVSRLGEMNTYLNLLKADNINNKNLFEIQSTVSSKLNLFLTDTLVGSQDSVISILNTNQGLMDDADVQIVFAYINKKDFTSATAKKNALPTSKSAWKDLLTKIITIEQDSLGVFGIAVDIPTITFLEGYANTEAGDGQATAQAYLSAATGYTHGYPLVYPDAESSAKLSDLQIAEETYEENVPNNNIILYPNPTQSGITLEYKASGDQVLKVEIRDLLGKLILITFIKELDKQHISLKEFNAGVYLLTVNRQDGELIYKTKLLKQD